MYRQRQHSTAHKKQTRFIKAKFALDPLMGALPEIFFFKSASVLLEI